MRCHTSVAIATALSVQCPKHADMSLDDTTPPRSVQKSGEAGDIQVASTAFRVTAIKLDSGVWGERGGYQYVSIPPQGATLMSTCTGASLGSLDVVMLRLTRSPVRWSTLRPRLTYQLLPACLPACLLCNFCRRGVAAVPVCQQEQLSVRDA